MEQVVLVNCALAARRTGDAGRGLAPTAFKMSPLPGLKSHSSSVCCTVAETPVSDTNQAPTHRF